MSTSMGKDAPIHLAAKDGDVEQVMRIVQNDPTQVHARGYAHETPLHVASHIEVARLLIDSGADINAPGWVGGHPLHMAASAGHSEIVKLLLEAGAEVDARQENGCTALHFAANAEIAQLLLDYGADLHAVTRFGQTPLHSAVNVAEIVNLLLLRGASASARNESGETPLHAAAASGNVDSASRSILQPQSSRLHSIPPAASCTRYSILGNSHERHYSACFPFTFPATVAHTRASRRRWWWRSDRSRRR